MTNATKLSGGCRNQHNICRSKNIAQSELHHRIASVLAISPQRPFLGTPDSRALAACKAMVPSVLERPLPSAVKYDLTSLDRVTITLPTGSSWTSGLHWHEQHVEYLQVVKGSVRVRLGDTIQIVSAPAKTSDAEGGQTVVEIKVDKTVRHEWSRAELGGEEVVVVERTDPEDGEKAIFFWNLNGVILDAQATSGAQSRPDNAEHSHEDPEAAPSQWLKASFPEVWVSLNLCLIFRALDNFPVFVNVAGTQIMKNIAESTPLGAGYVVLEGARFAEWCMAHVALGMAAVVGRICGAEPVRRRYTPDYAFARWYREKEGIRKHN